MASGPTTGTPLTLTIAGTRAIALTKTPVSSVTIVADSTNTGKIFYGDSSVTTTNGIPLASNQAVNFTYDLVWGTNGKIDLNKIYICTETDGNIARISYFAWDGM